MGRPATLACRIPCGRAQGSQGAARRCTMAEKRPPASRAGRAVRRAEPARLGAAHEHRRRLRRTASPAHRAGGGARPGARHPGHRRRVRGGDPPHRRARARHHRRGLPACAALLRLLPRLHRRRRPRGHGALRRVGGRHERAVRPLLRRSGIGLRPRARRAHLRQRHARRRARPRHVRAAPLRERALCRLPPGARGALGPDPGRPPRGRPLHRRGGLRLGPHLRARGLGRPVPQAQGGRPLRLRARRPRVRPHGHGPPRRGRPRGALLARCGVP